MEKTIAISGTFDTKGQEFLFVKELIESLGFRTFTIHTGAFAPQFEPDVSNREVALAAGRDIDEVVSRKDRAYATDTLAKGMELLLPKLYNEGKFDGIISLGGTGGTAIATAGMRKLPIGVPKVMVSTVASGNTTPYVGLSDLVMFPSIVDVAGINAISTKILSNAVYAITGMLQHEFKATKEHKPLIAATMFGLTTPCVNYAKKYLEDRGYELVVFHATGIGGKTMESLIENGFFEGVLDITTTEWADETVGGVLAAGPHRLEAAGKHEVPQVVSLGAIDMVNFGPRETVPSKFEGRNFYQHNPSVTLMRTTVEENRQIGETIAEKLNMAKGYTSLLIPLKGLSGLDAEGKAFEGKEEDNMLFETVKEKLDRNKVEILEIDAHINDQVFGETAAKKLIELIEKKRSE
ncbi:Tm-1-like ATP-binding domain-containing protein [Fervidibacillus albus]|uniref:Tm-1-like ATP-binding domain-containing protein n=1 Tax=Fervidibacillus albus TaxID=2980026 RepID=A0A9E8LWQ9_9BACI|nr:Tm-1-like ATP-binding domain-containing protein [Fervidibacillus albus]WAA10971.1 Tm-1-like ATP-binding domain-containing protein [Fervidibacillus albus]